LQFSDERREFIWRSTVMTNVQHDYVRIYRACRCETVNAGQEEWDGFPTNARM
jgi:hypothetical protein